MFVFITSGEGRMLCILIKFFGRVAHGPKTKWLDFGSDPGHVTKWIREYVYMWLY